MLNCEVLVRDDEGMFITPGIASLSYSNDFDSAATVDDLIDVIMKDHRKYIRWLANTPNPWAAPGMY